MERDVTEHTKRKTGIPVQLWYDPIFLRHVTLPHHPERPERLDAVIGLLKENTLWDRLNRRAPDPNRLGDDAVTQHLLAVHSQQHLDLISRKAAEAELNAAPLAPFADGGDTNMSGTSNRAARTAAAAAMEAVQAVCGGEATRAFCAVRPPGHHCERSRPMGFCLYNNAAAAARFAQQAMGLERVAIVDWDVHHGNGTQAIFYDDPSVLYVSLHQYPHYPGTGRGDERGSGAAEGATLNVPLPAGTGEREYEEKFRGIVTPALRNFAPDLIVISAGFDAHRDDPLGGMLLTAESFALFTRILSDASSVCGGRIVSVLEGGYNLRALAASVSAHIAELGA
jgi:acetoin utilization deacetylase AcuC-like enzyme